MVLSLKLMQVYHPCITQLAVSCNRLCVGLYSTQLPAIVKLLLTKKKLRRCIPYSVEMSQETIKFCLDSIYFPIASHCRTTGTLLYKTCAKVD